MAEAFTTSFQDEAGAPMPSWAVRAGTVIVQTEYRVTDGTMLLTLREPTGTLNVPAGEPHA